MTYEGIFQFLTLNIQGSLETMCQIYNVQQIKLPLARVLDHTRDAWKLQKLSTV